MHFALKVGDLPEAPWDLLTAFEDVIEAALRDPSLDLDDVYQHLRLYFLRDTGMKDIVPDFVEDAKDLRSLSRYLGRMGVTLDEQVHHVQTAFEPLVEFMELVFRPRSTQYKRNYWPRQPVQTPFAAVSPLPPEAGEPDSDLLDDENTLLSKQAQRVLNLAPLALEGLERLMREREPGGRNSAEPLLWEEIDALHRLHRELGELLRLARNGRPLQTQWDAVAELVRRAFKIAGDTGDLIISGIPPLAASALPAYGTLKVCETMLQMDTQSSATLAAGVVAGTFALKPRNKVTGTHD